MSDKKINSILPAWIAASLISAPTQLPSSPKNDSFSCCERKPKQASLHRLKHELAPPPTIKARGKYVGELGEEWQFPSDHLPIGMSFEENNFLSWNVLDAKYMSWIEKNSQGLNGSMITDEHVYLPDSKLTIRDQHIVGMLLEMIDHPTHPRNALCLQECGDAFLTELQARIPEHFQLIASEGKAVLIDLRCFEILEAKEVTGIFTDRPERTLQEITLKRRDTGKTLRMINVHIPGDPTKPSRSEFGQYLATTFDPSIAILAMGDMNFTEFEMEDAIQEAFDQGSPFSLTSPYCTTISPHELNSKTIDHFLVYSPRGSSPTLSSPDQVLEGLDPIVYLLQPLESARS